MKKNRIQKRVHIFRPEHRRTHCRNTKCKKSENVTKSDYIQYLDEKVGLFIQILNKHDADWTPEDLEYVARHLVLFEESCVKEDALRLIHWCEKYPERLMIDSTFHHEFIDYLRFYFCDHIDSYAIFKEIYSKDEAREVAHWIYNVGIPCSEDGYVTLKDNSSKRLIQGLEFWSNLGDFKP